MPRDETLSTRLRLELQRVLESEAFRHSESLRRLLKYLGERCLNGEHGELKEYTIGVEAFDKPADYDPQQDPAVRVLASKLRHRLEDYYLKESPGSPIRIEIPRGHYELKFQIRNHEGSDAGQAELTEQVRRWRRIAFTLGLSIVILIAVVAVRWKPGPSQGEGVAGLAPQVWTHELELIWQPFLTSKRRTVISLGTPLFTKFNGLFFRNPRVNEWEGAADSGETKLLKKGFKSDYAVPSFPYTGVGEATGAFLLCRLLQDRRPGMVLKRSNVLSWEDIQYNDVIFLGSPKANLQLKDIPVGDGFVIERGAIRNSQPRPGESDAYRSSWRNHTELLEDYALIMRAPGLHGHGEIMMLGSASTEATWAAVEYVTQAAYAKDLVQRLRLPSGKIAPSYQVVIRARFRDQVPVEISYVTHRIL